MPGRPTRPKATTSTPATGKLKQILSGMAGASDPMSGVNVEDTSLPSDADIANYANNPDTTELPDSNTLAVRPSVTPTHWWNQGKANAINNQLNLQDYNSRMGIQNAVQQQDALTPGLVSREGQISQARVPAELAIGNAGVLNKNNILSMGDNGEAYNKLTLVNALGAANTALQAQESGNVLQNNKNLLAAQDQLRLHPTSANTADNAANLGLLESQSKIKLFGENTQIAQDTAKAKLLDEQNQAKARGFIPYPYGGGVANVLTGQDLIKPIQKPNDQILQSVADQVNPNATPNQARIPANNLFGNPGTTNIVSQPIVSNQGALPRLRTNPVPTDYSKDQYNVVDPRGSGKIGSIINGIFIPRSIQPNVTQ